MSTPEPDPTVPTPEAPASADAIPAVTKPKPPPENALANLMLNVLLPVTILSYCSKNSGFLAFGPKWALVVAMLLPIGYQIYDYRLRRTWNLFSIIGFVSVLLTGGLGLIESSAEFFALKEAAIPVIFAALFLFSHLKGKPLARTFLLNPDVVDIPRLERAVQENQAEPAFGKLLWTGTGLIGGTMLLSAAANYFLALYFLADTAPGSEARTAAIGRLQGWSFLIIGVPMLAMMGLAMFLLFRGLKRMTGLETDQLLLPR